MRFMVIVKSNEQVEAGGTPSEAQIAAMSAFNEELVKAGVLLVAEGLHPSAKGARLRYDDEGGTSVTDGPFTEAKELVGGFWILQVSSRAEALEWMRKAPFRGEEVEVRQVFETSDFGNAITPELAAAEDRMREMVAQQQRGS